MSSKGLKKIIRKKSIKKLSHQERSRVADDVEVTGMTVQAIDAYPILLNKLRGSALMIRGGDNWIRHLSDSHLMSVYELLKDNTNPEIIIKKVERWGYFVSIESKSDIAALRLYKRRLFQNTIHDLDPKTKEEKVFRKQFVTRAMQLCEEFDLLAEAFEVVRMQKDRVLIGHDAEIADERLNPLVTSEITTLHRMIHELITKAQSFGLLPEKPIEQVINMHGNFSSVMSLMAVDGSNKMLSITSKFLGALEEKVVEVEVPEDGDIIDIPS